MASAQLPSRGPSLPERVDAERAIRRVLGQAQRGSGGAVFLLGDAGMGKTTLLERARSQAAGKMSLAHATASIMERDLPFAFSELFTGPFPFRRLAAEHAGPSESLDRRAMMQRVARHQLRAWTRSGPVAVVLDDLHWADLDSLAVIGFLVRRLESLPVAIVAALRSWPPEARTLADTLAAERAADVMEVGPLADATAEALLTSLVGKPAARRHRSRVLGLSGGNPLLLSEAARVISERGELPEPGSGDVAPFRRQMLLGHLTGLPDDAVVCARAAATLGSRLRMADVEAISGLRAAPFAQAFDVLIAAGVLAESETGWVQFAHELLADAVLGDLAPAERRAWHRRAFDHFASRDDLAAAAGHALAADLTDESAVDVVTSAGRRALAAGAVQSALTLLEGAIRLAGPAATPALRVAFADSRSAAGMPAEALAGYHEVLAGDLDAAERREVRLKAARVELHRGRLAEAIESYRGLAADDGPPGGDLLLEWCYAVWELHGPLVALALLHEHAASRSETASNPELRAAQHYLQLEIGQPVDLADIDRTGRAWLRRVALEPDLLARPFNPLATLVTSLVLRDRFDEVDDILAELASAAPDVMAGSSALPLSLARLEGLLARGCLLEVVDTVDDLEEGRELDALVRPHVLLYRSQAMARQGRIDEARRIIEQTTSLPAVQTWRVAMGLGIAQGLCLLGEGRLDDAVAAYERVADVADRHGARHLTSPGWLATAIDAGVRSGHLGLVNEWIERLEAVPAEIGSPWAHMVALGGRASLATAGGDPAAATELFEAALGAGSNRPLDRAGIALRHGSFLRRHGSVSAARPILADVLAAAELAGAAPLAARAKQELAAAGGRRRRRQSSNELTAQELEVAQLAITGATAKEVAGALMVSPRTVESHLSRVYAKTGVSSKRELRNRWAELGLQAQVEAVRRGAADLPS